MSQPFSFPPPPPPPPKKQDHPPITDSRGGFRGRGAGRGQYLRDANQHSRNRGSHSYGHQRGGRGGNFVERSHAPKRDFTTAFHNQSQRQPKAPPAVPSFDADIQNLVSNKAKETAPDFTKRKGNSLGLTPTAEIGSDSEDDADDEARLAAASSSQGLNFEHKGQKLSLRTADEIAAWIAERKRRFPTQAKVAAAKREAEERKRQLAAQKEEQKNAREQAQKSKREAYERERSERERRRLKEKLLAAQIAKAKAAVAHNKEDVALEAKQKAERLRRKAERAVQELKLAEEHVLLSEQAMRSEEEANFAIGDDRESEDGALDVSDDSNDDVTSSSGSSDSNTDSESGPEEVTSRPPDPNQFEPPRASARKNGSDGPPPCKNLLKFGRCKFGKKCRYSHQIQKGTGRRLTTATGRRKGLYQVMVDKETEEEMNHALNAIIALGEQGRLNDTEAASVTSFSANIVRSS